MSIPGARRVEQIGGATLYLGDCLEILEGLGRESVDMIWTDPPYGHRDQDGDLRAKMNRTAGRDNRPIANDDPDSFRHVVDGMLRQAARILKTRSVCCCCCAGGGGGGGFGPTFAWVADRMNRHGLSFFHCVIWDKKNPGLGWRYRRQYEMVMVAQLARGRLLWWRDNVSSPNIIPIGKLKGGEAAWHPNLKPLALVEHFIQMHAAPGLTVLDPFMGSGTTGVACARLGRRFIGIELDEAYFDTACRRIAEAAAQGDLFVEPPPPPAQPDLI